MKIVYNSIIVLMLVISAYCAAEKVHRPVNIEANLRIIEKTSGAYTKHQYQRMLGFVPGKKIDGYKTLDVFNCNIMTGSPETKIETLRTEGSKVYVYLKEGQSKASRWALLYDFDPPIDKSFKVVGYPLERRKEYYCRCAEVIDYDPKFGGLKTLKMIFGTSPEDLKVEDWTTTEKWIVGIGDNRGFFQIGSCGWIGGGATSIIEAYNGEVTYFTSPDARHYNNYITPNTKFTQEMEGIERSVDITYDTKPSLRWNPEIYIPSPENPAESVYGGEIYAEGQKIFYATQDDSEANAVYHMIYDFSLMPGEKIRLTRIDYDPFISSGERTQLQDVEVECISVEPLENAPDFIAMNLMAYHITGPNTDNREPIGPTIWIKGIGSLAGLLNNCPSPKTAGAKLCRVSSGDSVVFVNPTAFFNK